MQLFRMVSRALKSPSSLIWWFNTTLLPKITVRLRRMFPSLYMGESRKGKIVMFHIGRSGSTVLGDLLNQDSAIFWDGEVFKGVISDSQSPAGEEIVYEDFFVQQQLLAGKNRYYGCEVKFFHLQELGVELITFIQQLQNMGFEYFVVLERKNYLRKIISSVMANQGGVWHQAASEKTKKRSVYLDINNVKIDKKILPLLSFIESYFFDFQRLRNAFEQCGVKSLWLEYEQDLLDGPELAYNKICSFVTKEPARVSVRYGRTNPYSVKSIVDNYDEVATLLQGTKYEWMLHD